MDTHLHHDHIESHLKSSDLLRDVVIGMSDGSTVPFSPTAGLSGPVDKSSIIIIAEIAAGSIGMGLGGIIRLIRYFFIPDSTEALKISVAVTLVCIFGYFKSKITGVHPLWGAVKVTLIGTLAAAAAFGVARLFEL